MDTSETTFLNRPVVSIPALIAESAERWHDRPALWRWVDGKFKPLTYAALMNSVAQLAGRLAEHGAGPGMRIAIRLGDRFAFGVTYLSVLWTGATAVPLDPLLTPTEITGILTEADVSLFVVDVTPGDVLKTHVIELSAIWPSFDAGTLTVPHPPAWDSESLATLLFTSGTTGYSKGVMLTHANIVTDILAIQEMGLINPTDKMLSVLPIHHAFESTVGFLYPLSIGAQVAFARSLKSNEILEDMRSTQSTVILAVPLMFEKMRDSIQRKISEASPPRRVLFSTLSGLTRLAHRLGWKTSGQTLFRAARRKAGLSSLRILASGGAALPPTVSQFFDVFGIPILQGYGLSEASPVVSVNRPGHHRYSTVGPPLPGVEVRIQTPGPDEIGEIEVKGPMVMRGYWKRHEESANVLKDGWLLTGDLGSIDSDGHIRIVGRSKNLIISGAGKNIYPEEIESVLNAQPGIAESMVYGKTRPGKTGEAVAAIIVPDPEWLASNENSLAGAKKDAVDRAVRHACALMAPFKRIVEWDLREEPFEKTSTRKIKRKLALQQLEMEKARTSSPTRESNPA